jgi:cation diffusion facilitator family transporter
LRAADAAARQGRDVRAPSSEAALRGRPGEEADQARDRAVRRVLIATGGANAAVLLAKSAVGLATGSLAIAGDALHSLTDLANNVVAWFVLRVAMQPPDREHPYGHRKFELLAVFALAGLLSVLGVELALGALRRETSQVVREGWALATMLGVLAINVGVASYEAQRARRLGSELLRADARHTFADVFVTIATIAGWQIASRGHPWLDSLFAICVALLILYLAYGLFRRALPALVDSAALDPETIASVVRAVPGVRGVRGVRSRWDGRAPAVDLVVAVDAALATADAHAIADRVEAAVRRRFGARDVTVHVEPDSVREPKR